MREKWLSCSLHPLQFANVDFQRLTTTKAKLLSQPCIASPRPGLELLGCRGRGLCCICCTTYCSWFVAAAELKLLCPCAVAALPSLHTQQPRVPLCSRCQRLVLNDLHTAKRRASSQCCQLRAAARTHYPRYFTKSSKTHGLPVQLRQGSAEPQSCSAEQDKSSLLKTHCGEIALSSNVGGPQHVHSRRLSHVRRHAAASSKKMNQNPDRLAQLSLPSMVLSR